MIYEALNSGSSRRREALPGTRGSCLEQALGAFRSRRHAKNSDLQISNFTSPPSSSSNPRSKNRIRSFQTDAPLRDVVTTYSSWESPRTPAFHEQKRKRAAIEATTAAHLASTSIRFRHPLAVWTLVLKLHCSDCAGLWDRSFSEWLPRKGRR